MTKVRAVFGDAPEDSPNDYELETFVSSRGEYVHYDTTYLTTPAARRLLVDLIHTLAGDGENTAEIVPEAFLERLDDITQDLTDEARSMGKGTVERMETVNRVRTEFGLDRLPEAVDSTRSGHEGDVGPEEI